MRLVLYSGGYLVDNDELNEVVMQMITHKSKSHITYIPAAYDDSDEYYEEFITQFTKLGVEYFSVFHVDKPFNRRELKDILKSDAIYLSGGNTFYFLKHLRESGCMNILKKYVDSGGILMGESAGSIIMCEDIATAGYPRWDRDENDVEITDITGLSLTDFNFFPHFEVDDRYVNELRYRSTLINKPIYAAPDCSGIVVDYEKLTFVGECYCFFAGKWFQIS